MLRTGPSVVALFSLVALSTPAGAADVAAGKELSLRWCAACHLVAADQQPAPTAAPPFAAIAGKPGFNADQLAKSIQFPHPLMPGRELSRTQAADVAAYIATLAK
ncbi:MAG: cytochrome c [Bradyrhizobiaceae bacterium]|nr:cytochrome c [Bradyrhizobiaceae bacterium]